MNRTSKKILSTVLALVMLFTAVVPSYAMTKPSWDSYWETDEAHSGITMFPGSNESERNFTWYTSSESTPSVEIKVLGESSAKTVQGECLATKDGRYVNYVTVTSLEEGVAYSYRCKSEGFESRWYSFATENDNSFSALYVTDVHVSYDDKNEASLSDTAYSFNQVIEAARMKSNSLTLVLSAGDQASEGREDEYIGFASSPAGRTLTFAPAIGNHDRKGIAFKTYKNFPNEQKNAMVSSYIGGNYWFVKGDVLFLVVDTNNGSGTDHAKFIRKAIKENPDAKWKVMMAHHDLYSGRIPRRESENQFLRLLWAPIVDQFGIDLVLLGHSHYYTVSNVLYNSKTVSPLENHATITDPAGTIYMVSGSLNRPRDEEEIGLSENIGIDYLTQEKIYNIIDFKDDSITVKSYTLESNEMFASYTIEKTSKDGGHPDKMTAFYQPIVRFIGTIYAFFNNIGVYSNLKEDGIDIGFFEAIF